MDAEQTPEPNGQDLEAKAEGVDQTKQDGSVDEKNEGPDVERILNESRSYKKRAQAAERRLKEKEESQLRENEKWKEAYEAKAGEYDSLQKKIVSNAVQSEVRQAAIRAGCIDPDAVVRLGDLSTLEYDPDTNSVVGVENLIQSMQADKSYLFSKPSAPVTSGIPMAPKDAPPDKPTMSSVAMELVSKKR